MSQVNNNFSRSVGQILTSNKTIAIVAAVAITSLACAIIIGCTCPINSFASSICLSSMTTLSFCSLFALASIAIISIKQHSKQNQKLSSRSSSISSVTSTPSIEETVHANKNSNIPAFCANLAITSTGSSEVKFKLDLDIKKIKEHCKAKMRLLNGLIAQTNIKQIPERPCFNLLLSNGHVNGKSRATLQDSLLNISNPNNHMTFSEFSMLFPTIEKKDIPDSTNISSADLDSLKTQKDRYQNTIKCNFMAFLSSYGIELSHGYNNTILTCSTRTFEVLDVKFFALSSCVLSSLGDAELSNELDSFMSCLGYLYSSINDSSDVFPQNVTAACLSSFSKLSSDYSTSLTKQGFTI